MNLIKIRKTTPEEMPTLAQLAEADGHSLIAPTYTVFKEDQMVGYLGVVPCVLLWMDTQRTNIRDALMVNNFYENTLINNGAQIIALPCVDKSPFKPLIPKLNYVDCGGTTLYLKDLTKG